MTSRQSGTHDEYVHGYTSRESERLVDQARTLTDLLHHDTRYAPGDQILEAGCGVGAQTIVLANSSPESVITSIDVSAASLEQAKSVVQAGGYTNVNFQQADIYDLPFDDDSFDHIFVCFVLEHLPNPIDAVSRLMKKLRPGGTITVIEGDHGSAYYYPRSEYAQQAIQCQIDLQAMAGGNSLIGRELYPLMTSAGVRDVTVSPRVVYVDSSKPELVKGFTRNTFTAMVEGVHDAALEAGMMDEESWDKGIRDLYRTSESDGTFCYMFFKGIGLKQLYN